MTIEFHVDMVVAIIRIADGEVLATATIDKINDREIRTDTPYEQRENLRHTPSRRYWRFEEPHTEMRIPKEEKAARVPCTIRVATPNDLAAAQHRVEVRRAKERMPRNMRDKEHHEHMVATAEEMLKRARQPYERLLEQISKDVQLIATERK